MGKKFLACVKAGHRVRTIVPKPGTYMHVCFPGKGKASIGGEIKHARTKLPPPVKKLKPT
jgi:hypothetical protein